MSKIRVAVLMGGKSAEREVSLSTGRQVLAALDPARYDAFPVDPAYFSLPGQGEQQLLGGASASELTDGEDRGDVHIEPVAEDAAIAQRAALVGRNRPDVAILCLHGRGGEDGTIQGMLELLEIPYTGSGVLASALAMDKAMAKKILALDGVPVPPGILVRGRKEADDYLAALRDGSTTVTCPAVVKPSRQGSTIGISIVQQPENMAAALATALHYDNEVVVEKFIDGIEITAPVLGNDDVRPLPLVEIVPNGGFYDYEAKYTPGATDEIVPARLSTETTTAAQELAVRSHRALGCRGFSRTDMLVAEDGIYVLEVNTIPGMTPTSLLPRSAEAAGLPFPELVDRMVQLALEGRSVESTSTSAA